MHEARGTMHTHMPHLHDESASREVERGYRGVELEHTDQKTRRADGEPARLPDSAPETDPAPEPAAPGEPTSSANATGIAATAEPTPNATANAPTRPTYRA